MRNLFTILFFSILNLSVFAQMDTILVDSNSKDSYTVVDMFSVSCNEKIWDINWKTLSEISNCKFAIEYSVDQMNWQLHEEFDGTAQSIGIYTYHTFVKRTSDSTKYFRLRYDATSSLVYYKNPVTNLCPEYIPENLGTTFIVDYNPSCNSVDMSTNISDNSKTNVQIFSTLGKLLFQEEILLNSQCGKISIPFLDSTKEIIIVKLSNGNQSSTKKIFIP